MIISNESISHAEYFEKITRNRAAAAIGTQIPPRSSDVINANTANVKKNIVGISTSISGTWVKINGKPSRNMPPKKPVSLSQSILPIIYVSTTVNEKSSVVTNWT